MKRWARSYSILDHHLLHGGYFQKLSHQALALYLFVAVVGDPEGKSFYGDPSIQHILHLEPPQLHRARKELLDLGLIDYRRPYWWVKSLTQQKTVPAPTHSERRAPNAPVSIRDILGYLKPRDPKEPDHA